MNENKKRSPKTRAPLAQRRVGYALLLTLVAVGYWAVGHIHEWSWVPFLSAEWADVVPWVRAAMLVTAAFTLIYLVRDPHWLVALGSGVGAIANTIVGVRILTDWPLEFSEGGFDWETTVRVLLIIGVVAGCVGALVSIVKAFVYLIARPAPDAPIQ